MRSYYYIVEIQKRIFVILILRLFVIVWFGIQHIDSGAGCVTIFQCLIQRLFVNKTTSGGINNPYSFFAKLQLLLTYYSISLRCFRSMQGYEIRLYQQILQNFTFLHTVFLKLFISNIRVICNPLHIAAFQLGGYNRAYPAKSDDTGCFSIQLVSQEFVSSEISASCGCICLRDVSEYAEGESDCQFCCSHYVAFRGVYNYDSFPCAGFHIYIVNSVACSSCNLKIFSLLNKLCIHFCNTSYDYCIIIFNYVQQFIMGYAIFGIYLKSAFL